MKKQAGITLIALIITIIVLLILAVVTIGAVQDGGIITHAQNATQKHVIGDEKERIQLAYSEYKISKYEPLGRTADQDELETFFLGENKQGKDFFTLINDEKSTNDTFIVDYKGEEIEIKLSEATLNNDTNEVYLYFSYNGYKYKLTVEDTNAAMTKKLEAIESKLKVEGADIIAEEKTTWIIKFSDTGNTYMLTGDGKVTQKTADILLLELYILGADLEGRPITDLTEDLANYKANTNLGIAAGDVKGLSAMQPKTDEWTIYIEYDGNKYKFLLGMDGGNPTNTIPSYGVVRIDDWNTESRVGKTVNYDEKIWTIIYDDSTNGLQMISNQSLLYNNSEFCLGYKDSSITDSEWDSLITVADLDNNGTLNDFEKTIYSYNNAIDTLNTACENLLKDAEGKYKSLNIADVRCVGSNPTNKSAENETLYTSEKLASWPINNPTYVAGIVNGRVKSTDTNYVSDIDRLVALGISIGYDSVGEGLEYWLASRFDNEYSRGVGFRIRAVYDWGGDTDDNLWSVTGFDVRGGYRGCALRPVVTLKSDVELVEDTTEEADYILN